MERIGFIGLGIMGAPMASNLCKAGYPPAVYDLNPTAVQRLTAQGSRELPPSAMGAECDVLFTILPNGSVVTVCFSVRTEPPPTFGQAVWWWT